MFLRLHSFTRLLLLSVCGLALLLPMTVSAVQSNPAAGLRETVATAELADKSINEKNGPALLQLAGRIIANALSLLGVLFFIIIVYAGFIWMTARGDETLINKAKESVTAAIIGVVVILVAYAVTNLVFNSAGTPSGGAGSTNPPITACSTDFDCPDSDSYCDAGQCKSILGVACAQDSDCIGPQGGDALMCSDERCVLRNSDLDLGLDAEVGNVEDRIPNDNDREDDILNNNPAPLDIVPDQP
ncbi:MAG: hypothetical protein HOE53_00715 [Candidatus Magasanikbacteria bacterium]|jgi:hypothetical protein|nr:hypothetical protein [Candidatus Magasanikbacteria bacterium]